MNLQCCINLRQGYKAAAQVVRVLTEDWCRRELYCAACESDRLAASRANAPGVDFFCPACRQPFQLKSFKAWNQRKIVDAGYDAMIRSIRSDRVPNLLVMQYTAEWSVRNLLLVPSLFFTESVIERRPPLGAGTRRAGWVGCNILLHLIPQDGRIAVVSGGSVVPREQVREAFLGMRGLGTISPKVRGWTLDVLSAVRRLGKDHFSLQELYQSSVSFLERAHPRNRNVRPKIRQQLQILRELGVITFVSPGSYALLR
jgi:type II restriction enzyme